MHNAQCSHSLTISQRYSYTYRASCIFAYVYLCCCYFLISMYLAKYKPASSATRLGLQYMLTARRIQSHSQCRTEPIPNKTAGVLRIVTSQFPDTSNRPRLAHGGNIAQYEPSWIPSSYGFCVKVASLLNILRISQSCLCVCYYKMAKLRVKHQLVWWKIFIHRVSLGSLNRWRSIS